MQISLANRLALVTGSTSGIGLSIAKTLASSGCNILFNGFASPEQIKTLQEGFTKQGVKSQYVSADLRDPADIKKMFTQIDSLGGIDILVNNAGIQHTDRIENFPEQKYEDIIKLNLNSAFYTTKYSLPLMQKKNWGRIINIASVHGLVASVEKSAYVAAKHGIVGLTKVTALENAQTNITCNAICPGWVLTDLVQKQIDARALKNQVSIEEAAKQLLSEKQPSKDFVSLTQLGQLALFLCSDAAAQIRGQAIPIDGGWTAQ